MEQPRPAAPSPHAPLRERARMGFWALRRLAADVTDPYYAALYLDSFDGKTYLKLARRYAGEPEGRRLLALRPSLEAADLADLSRLPPGTLGREYARYFRQHGIKPLANLAGTLTDSEYLAQRMRETHDLHHMLTGYAIDIVGEHELQAFQLGNIGTPSSLVALMKARRRNGVPLLRYLGRLWRAYRRGRRATPLPLIIWEDHWETPLTALRQRFLDGAGRDRRGSRGVGDRGL